MSLISLVDSFSKTMASSKAAVHDSGSSAVRDAVKDNRDNPTMKETESVVDELNKMSSMFNDNLIRFTLDHDTKRIVVKVIDSDTEEVVREIPERHSIRLLNHFREQMGVLFDKSI